jgi:hypothetical protein
VRRVDGGRAGCGVRASGEVTAAAEVEHDGGRHDRHHPAGHREADTGRFQPSHHATGRGQPVGAAAAEHHRVHPLHRGARVEQVGLPGARRGPAHVDAADRPAGRRQHDGGAAQRARTGHRGVPDP